MQEILGSLPWPEQRSSLLIFIWQPILQLFQAARDLEIAAAWQTTQSHTAQQAQQPYNQSDAVVVVPEGRLQVLHELGAAWSSCSAAFSAMHVGRWGGRWLKRQSHYVIIDQSPPSKFGAPVLLEEFWQLAHVCLWRPPEGTATPRTSRSCCKDADSSKKDISRPQESERSTPQTSTPKWMEMLKQQGKEFWEMLRSGPSQFPGRSISLGMGLGSSACRVPKIGVPQNHWFPLSNDQCGIILGFPIFGNPHN